MHSALPIHRPKSLRIRGAMVRSFKSIMSLCSYPPPSPPPVPRPQAWEGLTVITNLIRAQVRLMRYAAASTALLINRDTAVTLRQSKAGARIRLRRLFSPALFCCLSNERPSGTQLRPNRPGGNLTSVSPHPPSPHTVIPNP